MEQKFGKLLQPDIKLHRKYFSEMVSLLGIIVVYRAPKKNKTWTTYTEIESNYEDPISVGCIFQEHVDQKTMKKMGWVSELQESASIIHVPYDLPGLQVGALFIVPSGIDCTKGRLFRVTSMSNIMVYPASIACEIVPEYETTFEKSLEVHEKNSLNILREEEFILR